MHSIKFLQKAATPILWSALAIAIAIPQSAPAWQNSKGSASQPTKYAEKKGGEMSTAPSSQDIENARSQGQVWVNTSTHVYHKSGPFYGKTKHGKFMTEEDARKNGFKEAKESRDTGATPHKKDQSGLDSTIGTHSSNPPKP